MIKRSMCFLSLFFVFVGTLYAQNTSSVILEPGANEIKINLLNKCNEDLQEIRLITESSKIPKGITIAKDSTVFSIKDDSKICVRLNIDVKNISVNEEVEIPFILKDNKNSKWSYTIVANIIENKPQNYNLLQNYPNPFNSRTKIEYSLPDKNINQVKIIIYDINGKKVKTLVNGRQNQGRHETYWDGKNSAGIKVSSGIYFCKMISGSFTRVKKLVFLE